MSEGYFILKGKNYEQCTANGWSLLGWFEIEGVERNVNKPRAYGVMLIQPHCH